MGLKIGCVLLFAQAVFKHPNYLWSVLVFPCELFNMIYWFTLLLQKSDNGLVQSRFSLEQREDKSKQSGFPTLHTIYNRSMSELILMLCYGEQSPSSRVDGLLTFSTSLLLDRKTDILPRLSC